VNRRVRRSVVLTGAATLGVAGALVLWLGLSGGGSPVRAAQAVAAASAPATLPSGSAVGSPSTTPAQTPVARFTPSSTVHLLIPAVHLDLPLLALTPQKGVINPPTLTAGYWIEPYGEPGADPKKARNTLYIAAHSAQRGHDGFDPLLAPDHQGSALVAGNRIQVRTPGGTANYTVEGTRRYAKNALPGATDVWESRPGRLVLITCFLRADGRPSTENMVVFAKS
jgi:hypothetical protein